MASINESGYKTFQATAVAITAHKRVTVDSAGLIAVSGAANDWIGVTTEDIAASGYGTVRLKNAPGTFFFTASAAITRGNNLFPTASGKVDDAGTTGGAIGFVALEAATADDDVIEAAPTDAEGGISTLGDGQNIVLGTTTGTKIGTSVSQKLGLYNATPIIQPLGAWQGAITDSTGATTVGTFAAGVGIYNLSWACTLASITGAMDVLTTLTPGHKFKLLALDAFVSEPVATAAKAATLNLEIGTTNVTGGEVALTSANCATMGAKVAGAAITAANTGSSSDTISIEAASVTAFVDGAVNINCRIQNMDTADDVASLAEKWNELRSDLVALGIIKGAA
jgi:hypothetical protein